MKLCENSNEITRFQSIHCSVIELLFQISGWRIENCDQTVIFIEAQLDCAVKVLIHKLANTIEVNEVR